MVQLQKKNDQNILRRAFLVRNRNTNADGLLDTCKLLKEMVGLNDQAIIRTFGSLNYDAIITWNYNINFNGRAVLNDLVELVSSFVVAANGTLQIQVSVNKKAGARDEVIASGQFTFAQVA